jgi:F1F0 ATPase subunit 2
MWQLIIYFIFGLLMGMFYFGGLWLTVQQIPRIKHPFSLLFGSFLLRIIFVLIFFYLIIQSSLNNQNIGSFIACILGFLITRTILINYLQPQKL